MRKAEEQRKRKQRELLRKHEQINKSHGNRAKGNEFVSHLMVQKDWEKRRFMEDKISRDPYEEMKIRYLNAESLLELPSRRSVQKKHSRRDSM